MTTNAPLVFKKESVSTLEELNDAQPSLASNLAQLFGRRSLEKSGAAYVNRLKAMLSESNIGKQSVDILNKSGYLVDFDEKADAASRIDPESKRIFLASYLSKETNALSLVHAARTIFQMENNARPAVDMTVSSYLAAAKACKADAMVTQMLYAVEMRDKDPKIYKEFRANGNQEICALYEQTGKLDRPMMIDHYLSDMKSPANVKHTQQACCELNCRMAALKDGKNAGKLFTQDKTAKEIMNAACKDYDNKTYYEGKHAVDEPARVTIPSKDTITPGKWGDEYSGMLKFMHEQKRTAESLGLKNVKVAYDPDIDMAELSQKRNDQTCWNPRRSRGGISIPPPPPPKKEQRPVGGSIRRHYGGR